MNIKVKVHAVALYHVGSLHINDKDKCIKDKTKHYSYLNRAHV